MQMKISDCGWQTVTTKSRLNALLGAFTGRGGITQSRYVWTINGVSWEGSARIGINLTPTVSIFVRLRSSRGLSDDANHRHATAAVVLAVTTPKGLICSCYYMAGRPAQVIDQLGSLRPINTLPYSLSKAIKENPR